MRAGVGGTLRVYLGAMVGLRNHPAGEIPLARQETPSVPHAHPQDQKHSHCSFLCYEILLQDHEQKLPRVDGFVIVVPSSKRKNPPAVMTD
eukprot:gene26206-biopygen14906